ncbi:hypothetical protein PMIN06_006279 [Paraphaeosphaeria minitans]|uniref:Uncharacterized protein n=1 Tax=Paraphaeosphaeria minitans TaxID=565426 RepID=A0A9P6KWC4_9PLEO|nr:hypothetical protein PMIN01_00804 [Paraphaeosphaeria minitans]
MLWIARDCGCVYLVHIFNSPSHRSCVNVRRKTWILWRLDNGWFTCDPFLGFPSLTGVWFLPASYLLISSPLHQCFMMASLLEAIMIRPYDRNGHLHVISKLHGGAARDATPRVGRSGYEYRRVTKVLSTVWIFASEVVVVVFCIATGASTFIAFSLSLFGTAHGVGEWAIYSS